MLRSGDKVLYPLHGAGTVETIGTKESGDGLRLFYTVSLINSGMVVSIPVLTAKMSGLRPVLSYEDMEKAISHFGEQKTPEEPNWNKRCRQNLELLRFGDINKTAAVYGDLKKRNEVKMLSSGERKIFISAKNMLVTEIMLVYGIEKAEAEEKLDSAF